MDNQKIKLILIIVAVVLAAAVVLKILSFAVALIFKILLPIAAVGLIIYGVYWFMTKRR